MASRNTSATPSRRKSAPVPWRAGNARGLFRGRLALQALRQFDLGLLRGAHLFDRLVEEISQELRAGRTVCRDAVQVRVRQRDIDQRSTSGRVDACPANKSLSKPLIQPCLSHCESPKALHQHSALLTRLALGLGGRAWWTRRRS